MLRRLPIAAQVMLLVALAVLAASAAQIAVTFAGPPPRQEPQRIERMAAVLRGEARPTPGAILSTSRTAPAASEGLHRRAELETQLAARLGLPPGAVRAFAENGPPMRDGFVFGRVRVAVAGERGWTVLDSGRDRALSRWQWVTASTVLGVAAAILLLGLLIARRIAEPIRSLGQAAGETRAGERWTLDPPPGPPEVRRAALALRDLHERTLEHAEQRLTMLGAIAHDIGTPVARIAFRLEQLPEVAREAAMADIATVRLLLADSLTLARGWQGEDAPVDLAELAHDATRREIALGHAVSLDAGTRLQVLGHRLSLERMLQNLIDNGLRYGGSAHVRLANDNGEAVLEVSDNGSGFPDIPAEQLLKPYIRGEASRNRETGGSGLGLAIVAQVVDRHHGTIELGRAQGGGARVTVRLPVAG